MSDDRTDTEFTVPVTEERLELVRRDVVQTGGAVRVRKSVDEVPTPVTAPVTLEVVDVQRIPVGRVVDQPPAVRQEGDVTVIPVVEERLVVRKELVLLEEIHLTRRRETAQAQAEVVLRREHVEVERQDPGTGQWLPEAGSRFQQHDPKEQ